MAWNRFPDFTCSVDIAVELCFFTFSTAVSCRLAINWILGWRFPKLVAAMTTFKKSVAISAVRERQKMMESPRQQPHDHFFRHDFA
jgi:hypothetical protein